MAKILSTITRQRLNVQGMSDIDDETLAEVIPWQRMAFFLCALLAGIGTALASPVFLWVLVPVAALAAFWPVFQAFGGNPVYCAAIRAGDSF